VVNPVTPLTPQEVELVKQQVAAEGLLQRTVVQLDILIDVACGGVPGMTISSRASIAAQQGQQWGIDLDRWLNHFEADHGPKAQVGDTVRAQELESADHPPESAQ
jgi:hypothetical protein